MKASSRKNTCEWVETHLDAYLDGELGSIERSEFETHMIGCAECHHEVALAKRLQVGFKDLSVEKCPDRVIDTVYSEVEREIRIAKRDSWSSFWKSMVTPAWRPVMITALVAGIGFTAMFFNQPEYSDQEVEQALREAKMALAILGEANDRANAVVRDDVIRGSVAAPLQGVLDRTLSAFDSQNDSHN